ncbi:hypothetical protein SRB17_03060 [Streptomyces sp. RB17]|uniref:hypothetical protein n=1 Tax=Streptomyces sp. RB17 TaxID=2585197 RepID=UPI0013071011|nr:hypothetical protein [Streptomyces sp. RB17]MQY32358.1 hypothetical protein [Streptomyces sp. RB17]
MAFNTEHPVFFTLMHGPGIPGRMAETHDQPHVTPTGRIEDLLASLMPGAPADVTRTAHVCLGIHKSGLEPVLAHEGPERADGIQGINDVLIRSLHPLVGDRPGRQRSGRAPGRRPPL